jgi:hypothetical protein
VLEKTPSAEIPVEPKGSSGWRSHLRDPEILIAFAALLAAAIAGLMTIGDFGVTVDEWNADDYGVKALAWYLSGFTDRSLFTDVEDTLWYYGPWPHLLITLVQSLGLAGHWAVRHAMTFVMGIAAVAMLLPMGRMSGGRWAGAAAVVLCLTTGYLYGSLPFTPIDVPFLFAMTAATWAIMHMAERSVPTWPASIAAGLLTGLAIATRSSGFITQAYLVGAMALCALDIALTRTSWRADLARLGLRTLGAFVSGWALAFCLWPWLQVGNPFVQFIEAFRFFANHPASWKIPFWGGQILTNDLPLSYVPSQLLLRLPEGFLVLLAVGATIGVVRALRGISGPHWIGRALRHLGARDSRQMLIVWAAAFLPIAFVMLDHSTLYNGARHILFVIPMLALVAGAGFAWVMTWLGRIPIAAASAVAIYLIHQSSILAALHPLEYIAFNSIAGGVHGAYRRFEMDYWSAAATVALRRLEQTVSFEKGAPGPKLLICIPWREQYTDEMYHKPWTLVTDAREADYIIKTESATDCTKNGRVELIDVVKRSGRAFAWTYARRPAPDAADRRP